ncbi:MAG: hypothetical protein ACI8Y4_005382 [Candidatus Poriferisodalaceae bacterium]|jgi:hypothetical protein
MKYMVEYGIRTAGQSHDQNLANQEALLTTFGKWAPEEGLTVHAFVGNMNNGGYVLLEADDVKVVFSFVSKFFAWNDIEVVPVLDIAESVAISTESLAWAQASLNS